MYGEFRLPVWVQYRAKNGDCGETYIEVCPDGDLPIGDLRRTVSEEVRTWAGITGNNPIKWEVSGLYSGTENCLRGTF